MWHWYYCKWCCMTKKSWCEQFQKAKEKGWADLTTITVVTSSASSIHADSLTTYPHCNKCGYSHPSSKSSPGTVLQGLWQPKPLHCPVQTQEDSATNTQHSLMRWQKLQKCKKPQTCQITWEQQKQVQRMCHILYLMSVMIEIEMFLFYWADHLIVCF